MVNSSQHDVLIAGGGIGGLATALALARRGISSRVLERRGEPSEDGAGIQIGPNGTRLLSSLGVSKALVPFVGVPEGILVHDCASGRVLAQLPLGDWIGARHGSPYWVAHRVDLHAVLLDAVRGSALVDLELGAEVVAVHQDDDEVVVGLGDGGDRRGGVVVGCDGIWSKVRGLVFDRAGALVPRYSGKSAARAVIPIEQVPDQISRSHVSLWMSAGAHVVVYPIRTGNALAVVVISPEKSVVRQWGVDADPTWVVRGVSGFARPVAELVSRVPAWRKWGLHETVAVPSMAVGRVGLLGDAAHPVTPFLAQGAVMALEDAAVLASCLNQIGGQGWGHAGDGVVGALQAYQAARRARVCRVRAASRRQGQIYHMSGAMASARDMALKYVPGERMMARYDWLYGWRSL